MPDFNGIENLYLILFFIVPGIVIVYVRSRFITGRMPSMSENVLSFLVLSLVYYSLTIPFIEELSSIKEPWKLRALTWVCLTLIGPAILGFILGLCSQKEWFSWIFDKVDVCTIHVIPTAWDWKFSKIPRGGQFLMITLTNDQVVVGFFGPNSFASSDSTERDLYLEEEYILSEDKQWLPRPDKVGFLVPS